MKKFGKLLFTLLLFFIAFYVVIQFQNVGLSIGAFVVLTIVLISTLKKSSKNKNSAPAKNVAANTSSVPVNNSRDEDLKLYELASLYSCYRDLKEYASVEFRVFYNNYVYTFDAYVNLDNCEPDANKNDIVNSLKYHYNQLAQSLLSEAQKITDKRITIKLNIN